MKPVHRVEIQDWMKAPETKAVMAALNGEASAPQALFVGGCVRNIVLGAGVSDIDIATSLSPEAVTKALERAGVKVIPTGIEHGTVTAVSGERSFEITTLRKDVATDGRRAEVAFTDNWARDAQRRDFTINTLLMDMEANIYDPLGYGMADVSPARIVFVGDPAQRIAEDYLRVLRFFRFHAWYGRGEMEQSALKACAEAADKIPGLSKERITQEFFKLLQAPEPVAVIRAMFEAGVLKTLAPGTEALNTLGGVSGFTARLYVMLGVGLSGLDSFEEYMIFPKRLLAELKAINQVVTGADLREDHGVKVALYRYGRSASAQAAEILNAQGALPDEQCKRAVVLSEEWDIPKFPTTGEDLITQGEKPGPALGEKLKRLEQDWIDRGFRLAE